MQGRWKQKGEGWRAKNGEVTWGVFLSIIRVINIAAEKRELSWGLARLCVFD
jgi:hypothetical protein